MKNSHPLESGYKLAKQKFDKLIAWLTPPLKEYRTYVSFSHNNQKRKALSTPLNSSNHAFWIGKFPRKPDADENIYTKELLAGILDYMGANVPKGEKGVLYISRTLSELMNGHEDAKDCLTTEEQIALLKKMKNKYAPDLELEIVDLEKSPMHSALFQELRKQRQVEGVDTGWALGTGDMSLDCPPEETSLRIARILYVTSQKHPEFKAKLDRIVPKKLQSKIPEVPSIPYYGLVEIAIRMSELLHGRSAHGGAERQKMYDDLIQVLIAPKASSDSWDAVRESTKAIREKFVGTKGEMLHDFDGIYIDTSQNYFMKKSKWIKKKQRNALVAAGITASTIGGFQAGTIHERLQHQQIQTEKEKAFEKAPIPLGIFTYDSYDEVLAKESVPYLQAGIDKIMAVMVHRIPLPWGIDKQTFWQDLRTEIESDIYDHTYEARNIYESGFYRAIYIERFILRNSIFFINKRVTVPPRSSQLPFSVKELREMYATEFVYGNLDQDAVAKAEHVQDSVYSSSSNEPTPAIYRYNGRLYGLAIYADGERNLSQLKFVEAVTMMMRDLAVEDIASLPVEVYEDLQFKNTTTKEVENDGRVVGTLNSKIFEVSYKFTYVYEDSKRVLLAKRPNEKHFSSRTAREAIETYELLHDIIGSDDRYSWDLLNFTRKNVVDFFRHSIKK